MENTEVEFILSKNLKPLALTSQQRLVKRMFDLAIGGLVSIVAFPFLLLVALIIKLDSPGPVLFRQVRIGENGKFFLMYKFRSMDTDADERLDEVLMKDSSGNLIHKTSNDPRVTRFGQLLRRTSIDEVPNLVNVIKGEMSLVGPRPEMPFIVELYQPWQFERFSIPQGMTGWWQINGRSERLMHMHTEDDIYYIRNYSLWLDIKILLRTIPAVLKRKGAF
jgi:lipopolysaccharide/colanic/teichoic acid biosynthesis glycosyltransferase